ncbi:MAG: response regulator transcription factor [Bacteroidetes bacterium]|nr:response regulator transcription factor [Bacteroidota bacterium]
MTHKHISIVLADEHALYREALATSLEQSHLITIVGQSGTDEQAEHLFRELQPDILLIDITMHTSKGIETSTRILANYPNARIIWLSTFIREAYYLRAKASGIRGYLAKSMPYPQIMEAIQTVYSGRKYLRITPPPASSQ